MADKGKVSMQTEKQKGFVSLRRVAESLGLSRTATRRLLKEGRVKAYRLSSRPGGAIRFKVEDVQQYLSERKEEPT